MKLSSLPEPVEYLARLNNLCVDVILNVKIPSGRLMYRRFFHRRYFRKRFFILFIILACLVAATWLATKITYEYFVRSRAFNSIIMEAGDRHCIDPCLLKAVIWRESRFNPNVRGGSGEIGLMQVRRNFAGKDWADNRRLELPEEGVFFYPSMNIEVGAWYLSRALKRFKDFKHSTELALSEYNAGYAGMKSWIPSDPGGEVLQNITNPNTKEYVSSIIEKYNEYSEERPNE